MTKNIGSTFKQIHQEKNAHLHSLKKKVSQPKLYLHDKNRKSSKKKSCFAPCSLHFFSGEAD